VKPGTEEKAGPARGLRPAEAPEPVSLLLVDDRPDRLAALEAALSDLGEGIDLVKAASGKEALRALLHRDFAAIFLDVHMPVMDGFETASLVRQRRRSESTPIIFLTAFGPNEAQVTRGYALGAVDYIFAPALPEVLRAKAAVFIDLHRKTAQVGRQANWLREEAERRAERLETRLRGILDRLDVGVFRASRDGRILEANRAFLSLLGLPDVEEANRRGIWEHFSLGREGTGVPVDAAPWRTGDLRYVGPDGTERWHVASVTAARSQEGEDILDGILEDITARHRAEEDLARSNADLQRFAHVVSHDLQEPLRMVSTFTEILSRRYGERLDGEARQFLTYAREGAERMQGMIHGLLDFCALENTRGRRSRTEVNRVFDRVLADLQVAVREAGAEVTRGDLPVVEADDLLLGNVLQNLVGNGVKFRRDGVPPRVHVDAERRGEEWVLSVRDNGIGVDPASADRLFMIFHRLPGSERFPGHGMGLALAKRIVERHGGRIWLDPAPEGGSVFRFTLPATPAEPGKKETP
jgi:PAS domain S-box-containing protein